ncbi:hypothetical protein CXG81DRAFT_21299, partial [Caulochytrium protostelioides]
MGFVSQPRTPRWDHTRVGSSIPSTPMNGGFMRGEAGIRMIPGAFRFSRGSDGVAGGPRPCGLDRRQPASHAVHGPRRRRRMAAADGGGGRRRTAAAADSRRAGADEATTGADAPSARTGELDPRGAARRERPWPSARALAPSRHTTPRYRLGLAQDTAAVSRSIPTRTAGRPRPTAGADGGRRQASASSGFCCRTPTSLGSPRCSAAVATTDAAAAAAAAASWCGSPSRAVSVGPRSVSRSSPSPPSAVSDVLFVTTASPPPPSAAAFPCCRRPPRATRVPLLAVGAPVRLPETMAALTPTAAEPPRADAPAAAAASSPAPPAVATPASPAAPPATASPVPAAVTAASPLVPRISGARKIVSRDLNSHFKPAAPRPAVPDASAAASPSPPRGAHGKILLGGAAAGGKRGSPLAALAGGGYVAYGAADGAAAAPRAAKTWDKVEPAPVVSLAEINRSAGLDLDSAGGPPSVVPLPHRTLPPEPLPDFPGQPGRFHGDRSYDRSYDRAAAPASPGPSPRPSLTERAASQPHLRASTARASPAPSTPQPSAAPPASSASASSALAAVAAGPMDWADEELPERIRPSASTAAASASTATSATHKPAVPAAASAHPRGHHGPATPTDRAAARAASHGGPTPAAASSSTSPPPPPASLHRSEGSHGHHTPSGLKSSGASAGLLRSQSLPVGSPSALTAAAGNGGADRGPLVPVPVPVPVIPLVPTLEKGPAFVAPAPPVEKNLLALGPHGPKPLRLSTAPKPVAGSGSPALPASGLSAAAAPAPAPARKAWASITRDVKPIDFRAVTEEAAAEHSASSSSAAAASWGHGLQGSSGNAALPSLEARPLPIPASSAASRSFNPPGAALDGPSLILSQLHMFGPSEPKGRGARNASVVHERLDLAPSPPPPPPPAATGGGATAGGDAASSAQRSKRGPLAAGAMTTGEPLSAAAADRAAPGAKQILRHEPSRRDASDRDGDGGAAGDRARPRDRERDRDRDRDRGAAASPLRLGRDRGSRRGSREPGREDEGRDGRESREGREGREGRGGGDRRHPGPAERGARASSRLGPEDPNGRAAAGRRGARRSASKSDPEASPSMTSTNWRVRPAVGAADGAASAADPSGDRRRSDRPERSERPTRGRNAQGEATATGASEPPSDAGGRAAGRPQGRPGPPGAATSTTATLASSATPRADRSAASTAATAAAAPAITTDAAAAAALPSMVTAALPAAATAASTAASAVPATTPAPAPAASTATAAPTTASTTAPRVSTLPGTSFMTGLTTVAPSPTASALTGTADFASRATPPRASLHPTSTTPGAGAGAAAASTTSAAAPLANLVKLWPTNPAAPAMGTRDIWTNDPAAGSGGGWDEHIPQPRGLASTTTPLTSASAPSYAVAGGLVAGSALGLSMPVAPPLVIAGPGPAAFRGAGGMPVYPVPPSGGGGGSSGSSRARHAPHPPTPAGGPGRPADYRMSAPRDPSASAGPAGHASVNWSRDLSVASKGAPFSSSGILPPRNLGAGAVNAMAGDPYLGATMAALPYTGTPMLYMHVAPPAGLPTSAPLVGGGQGGGPRGHPSHPAPHARQPPPQGAQRGGGGRHGGASHPGQDMMMGVDLGDPMASGMVGVGLPYPTTTDAYGRSMLSQAGLGAGLPMPVMGAPPLGPLAVSQGGVSQALPIHALTQSMLVPTLGYPMPFYGPMAPMPGPHPGAALLTTTMPPPPSHASHPHAPHGSALSHGVPQRLPDSGRRPAGSVPTHAGGRPPPPTSTTWSSPSKPRNSAPPGGHPSNPAGPRHGPPQGPHGHTDHGQRPHAAGGTASAPGSNAPRRPALRHAPDGPEGGRHPPPHSAAPASLQPPPPPPPSHGGATAPTSAASAAAGAPA